MLISDLSCIVAIDDKTSYIRVIYYFKNIERIELQVVQINTVKTDQVSIQKFFHRLNKNEEATIVSQG